MDIGTKVKVELDAEVIGFFPFPEGGEAPRMVELRDGNGVTSWVPVAACTAVSGPQADADSPTGAKPRGRSRTRP